MGKDNELLHFPIIPDIELELDKIHKSRLSADEVLLLSNGLERRIGRLMEQTMQTIQFNNWWNDNAKKYLDDIDLLQEGCFSHCSDDTITDTASDIVDRIYEQPGTDPLNSTMIMLQYLYEKYKLEPLDCEILGQLITVGLNLQTKFTAESICKAMLGDDFDIEAMLSEAPPIQKRGFQIILYTISKTEKES